MRDVTGIDPTRTILIEVGELTDEQGAILACHPLYAAGPIELQPLGRWAVVFWASEALSAEEEYDGVRGWAIARGVPVYRLLDAGPVRDAGVFSVGVGYRAAMKTIEVVKKGAGWVGQTNGRTVARGATKAEAVKAATDLAKKGKEPTSVRIHKTDGEFQQERTYPRAADPRRSEG